VARELTKKFEEYRIGSASELYAYYSQRPPKGEIALVIEAATTR
jgi:16S rRNA (cytidine1402-2'-O)-methyltransferase